MKINYLKDATNLQELKTMYFTLAKKHHPDVKGGNLETMKIINNEYDYLKGILKNAKTTKKAETETSATMEGFKEVIDVLIKYPNVKIEIVGAWCYISGYGTFKIKEEVLYNQLHCKYSKSLKKFYWYKGIKEDNGYHKGGYYNKAVNKYGIETIMSQPQKQYALV
jgi:curved DNA-binding protein CbpA